MIPPIERIFLWFLATDPELAQQIRETLDLGRLPNDEWRRLYQTVIDCRGDLDRVLDAVRDWPWGYHQFHAAAEIDSRVLLRAEEHLDQLIHRYNWRGARHLMRRPRRRKAA
jgi:hypothetical protein